MSKLNENKSLLSIKPAGIDTDTRDYSKEPYFIKKNEQAWRFLQKAGIPEDIKKKKK